MWHDPPKHRLTFTGVYGFISQKTETFIAIAVRSSYANLISVLLPWQFLDISFGFSLSYLHRKFLPLLQHHCSHLIFKLYAKQRAIITFTAWKEIAARDKCGPTDKRQGQTVRDNIKMMVWNLLHWGREFIRNIATYLQTTWRSTAENHKLHIHYRDKLEKSLLTRLIDLVEGFCEYGDETFGCNKRWPFPD
jgi:hypothetical protein